MEQQPARAVQLPLFPESDTAPADSAPSITDALPAAGNPLLTGGRSVGPHSSPSQTIDYLTCPRLWWLKRRWQRRGAWTPHRAVGAAIHAGWAAMLTNRPNPLKMAHETLMAEILEQTGVDYEIAQDTNWPLSDLEELVGNGLAALGKANPLGGMTPLMVETPLTPSMIPDVICQDGDAVTVVDLKTRYKLDSAYVAETLSDTVHDWQLRQYAWGYRELTGVAPTTMQRVLLVLTPRPKVHVFRCPVGDLAVWGIQAQWTWENMEEMRQFSLGTLNIPMATTQCRTKFGRCDFYDACHVLDCDEEKMERFYDRRPPRAARS